MSNGITSTDNLWQCRLRQSSFHMHLVVIYTGVASAIYPGRQYKFQIITIIHFFYEHDIICIATPYNIRTRQNIWIRQILQSMNTTNFALLPRVYCIGYASTHIPFTDTFFPPSLPPPVSMLAPRNQTSGFCRSNIELGERGALFLSNYMKLQQLSHSFWQRLSWWWSMVFGIW